MNDQTRHEALHDHPQPWRKVVSQSAITVKDASGATVFVIPFTGVASRQRKHLAADLILRAVNGTAAARRSARLSNAA